MVIYDVKGRSRRAPVSQKEAARAHIQNDPECYSLPAKVAQNCYLQAKSLPVLGRLYLELGVTWAYLNTSFKLKVVIVKIITASG